MISNSVIYDGHVIHKRFKPKEHYFKYKVFSLLIDLDEIEEISKKIKIFSYNKFNLISFFDKDHGPRDGTSPFNSLLMCNDFATLFTFIPVSPLYTQVELMS